MYFYDLIWKYQQLPLAENLRQQAGWTSFSQVSHPDNFWKTWTAATQQLWSNKSIAYLCLAWILQEEDHIYHLCDFFLVQTSIQINLLWFNKATASYLKSILFLISSIHHFKVYLFQVEVVCWTMLTWNPKHNARPYSDINQFFCTSIEILWPSQHIINRFDQKIVQCKPREKPVIPTF